MTNDPDSFDTAALLADPVRAALLAALVDGPALTATELSQIAGISAQSAARQLKQMVETDLLTLEKYSGARYFRLCSPALAQALEAHAVRAAAGSARPTARPGPRDPALRQARSCYDHLAGAQGVAMAQALLDRGYLRPSDRDFQITATGEIFFHAWGLDLTAVRRQRRVFARHCLDWSERRPHIGGAFGAALLAHLVSQGWARQEADSRRVEITAKGSRALAALTAPRLQHQNP